jgi:hypothetical protein
MELKELINPYESFDIQDLPNETWAVIPDFQKFYHISNFGRIKSFKNNKITILKTQHQNQRALRLKLTNFKGVQNYLVHNLMSKTYFSGKRVKHKDGNWRNNSIDNLEVVY